MLLIQGTILCRCDAFDAFKFAEEIRNITISDIFDNVMNSFICIQQLSLEFIHAQIGNVMHEILSCGFFKNRGDLSRFHVQIIGNGLDGNIKSFIIFQNVVENTIAILNVCLLDVLVHRFTKRIEKFTHFLSEFSLRC